MGSRGVLFAITEEQAHRLLAATDDDAVMAIVEELEEEWDEPNVAETDKAWDAIHRALTDGNLAWDDGSSALNLVILGGRRVYEGDDYIAVYKTPEQVANVAAALEPFSTEDLARRYREVVPRDYAPEYGDEDLAFTLDWFSGVAALYRRAASAGRGVLFTADQ